MSGIKRNVVFTFLVIMVFILSACNAGKAIELPPEEQEGDWMGEPPEGMEAPEGDWMGEPPEVMEAPPENMEDISCVERGYECSIKTADEDCDKNEEPGAISVDCDTEGGNDCGRCMYVLGETCYAKDLCVSSDDCQKSDSLLQKILDLADGGTTRLCVGKTVGVKDDYGNSCGKCVSVSTDGMAGMEAFEAEHRGDLITIQKAQDELGEIAVAQFIEENSEAEYLFKKANSMAMEGLDLYNSGSFFSADTKFKMASELLNKIDLSKLDEAHQKSVENLQGLIDKYQNKISPPVGSKVCYGDSSYKDYQIEGGFYKVISCEFKKKCFQTEEFFAECRDPAQEPEPVVEPQPEEGQQPPPEQPIAEALPQEEPPQEGPEFG